MIPAKPYLLLGGALLLAACGAPAAPAPLSPAQSVQTVAGTVVEPAATAAAGATVSWSGGAGTVSGTIAVSSGEATTTEVLATAALAANGDFALELPPTVDGSKLHAFTDTYFTVGTTADSAASCTGGPTMSTAAAHGATLLVKVQAQGRGSITPLVHAPNPSSQGLTAFQLGTLVYVDMPLRIQGAVTCSGDYSGTTITSTVRYQLNLAAGWNRVTIAESSDTVSRPGTALQTITLTSGALPTDTWLYSPYTVPGPVNPDTVGKSWR